MVICSVNKPADNSNPATSNPQSKKSPELAELQLEAAALREQVAQQAAEIARLRELSETDEITNIGNRRCFEKTIKRRHAELKREKRPYCLLLIDIDNFKSINDQFGHAIGDQWLQAIAEFLVRNVRTSDIVTRLGGDEFAIILPGTNGDQAKHVVDRLVDDVVLEVGNADADAPVRLSIGLVQANPNMTVHQTIELADRAMYKAKEQGGGQYLLHQ